MLLSGYLKPKLKASQNRREEGNLFVPVSQHDKVTDFLQLPAIQGKERGCLCVLDLRAQLGPCSPFSLSPASVPMMPRTYKKTSFLFQRQSYFLGEATAMYTMDEIWRGKAFQCTPGPGFQG